jgi:hypothetical protein
MRWHPRYWRVDPVAVEIVAWHWLAGATIVEPKEIPDPFGDVETNGGRDVLIARSHGAVGPPHERHNCAFGDAEREKDSGRGVAGVVQSTVADTCGGEQALPMAVVGPRVGRAAGLSPDPPNEFVWFGWRDRAGAA